MVRVFVGIINSFVINVAVIMCRYFDPETVGLDFEGMTADLEAAPEGSIIVLHGKLPSFSPHPDTRGSLGSQLHLSLVLSPAMYQISVVSST